MMNKPSFCGLAGCAVAALLAGCAPSAKQTLDQFEDEVASSEDALALLQEYPEGLSPAEMKILLRADRRLTNTCTGMWRNGLLRRVGRGRYVGA